MRAFRITAMILGVTLASLMYVHQQVELVKISYAIELKEKSLKDILDHNEGLGYNINNLESPLHLEKALLEERIEVAYPKRGHVVRLASIKRSGGSRRPYVFKASNRADIFAFLDYLTPKAEARANH